VGDAGAPHRGNIGAVVVTYHPDAGFGDRLEATAAQVAGLVVVDNSADDAVAELLRSAADRVGVQLVRNAGNLGVAAALSVGVRWAVGRGYEWVLTLDQDTVPRPDLVDGLVTVFQGCEFKSRLGAIGANYINAFNSKVQFRAEWFHGRAWRECPTVITSGTLLSLAACDTVGPFREEFFIDAVDHDYCLRLRSAGYRIVLSRDALMEHSLGVFERTRVLGKPIAHSLQAPARKYYITRNQLVLIREYLVREPRWVLDQVRFLIRDTARMLLFERSRLRKTAAVGLGVWHFLRRRMGALDARWVRRFDAREDDRRAPGGRGRDDWA
jgi:rhamnosyltransferase